MNNNARLWVEALRSGKYKQCFSGFKKDDTYCAIAVACEVSSKWDHTVYDWLGFKEQEKAVAFVILNDRDHKSFLEIADFIESHEDELFVKNEEENK